MAKRTTKRRGGSRRERKQQTDQTTASAPAATTSVETESISNPYTDIPADYSHTIGDLQRIAILASILIVAMVALSFFI